ncbi:MAG: flagellar filament capping protein FliD [Actinomycetota bacterium]
MSFIDGIVSGLDTSSIVSQLMAIERRPQDALIEQRSRQQAGKEELSGLRTDVNAIRDAAADLRLSSGWDLITATSSNPEAVSVTATTAATIGTYSFQVTSVASAASEYSDVYADTDTTLVNGTQTLADVAGAVNADSDLGFTAAIIDVGNGFRLQLTANETGADSTVDTSDALFAGMNFTTLSTGSDAELTIQGDNPFTVTSSTNTFDSLLPGVTVTVNATTTGPVSVSTERDVEALSEKVSAFVTSLNEFFTRVDTATVNTPDTDSVLQGNTEARKAADTIRSAFAAGMDTNDFTSVGIVGIQLSRQGQFEFDADSFADALASDPDMLAGLFADRTGDEDAELGALDRVIEAAEAAASVGDGYLYTAGDSADRIIEQYNRQIDSYERRLELRESTLRRTYANLEVALGGLQSQSNWLAGQLSSLGGTTS